jgi:hypothetical protein
MFMYLLFLCFSLPLLVFMYSVFFFFRLPGLILVALAESDLVMSKLLQNVTGSISYGLSGCLRVS